MTSGTVAFIGAVHEARPALDALVAETDVSVGIVVTHPSQSPTRPAGLVDLTSAATAAGSSVVHTRDANEPRVVDAVRSCHPDLLVVVGWTQLIRPELLAVPPRGCIGFHASLLPRHRGRSPVNWAILRGENLTGNTMMILSPGADTGDIVDQTPIPITPLDTCATVYDRVGQAGAAMLVKHLPALLTGTAPRSPQDPHAGDRLPRRTPEMGLIDWSLTSVELYDWIRALTSPYPGAFSSLSGRKVMVWASFLGAPAAVPGAPPGEIVAVDTEGVQVATGDGLLRLTQLSSADEEPCPAGDWSARAGLVPGMRFDPVPRDLALWCRGQGPKPEATR